MGAETKIEWCHATFNCWRGCTKVSAGCANCYAETLSGRNPGTLGVWGPNGTRVVAVEGMWSQPVKWDAAAKRAGERHRVFCASLADVFEDWPGPMHWSDGKQLWHLYPPTGTWSTNPGDVADKVPVTMQDVRLRLFRLIDRTPNLDWLLLTKRPQNVARMVDQWVGANPLPRNVWLGTSVENQQAADERIPHLLRVPAAVRFLSMEPLLGPVNLERVKLLDSDHPELGKPDVTMHALTGWHGGANRPDRTRIDWVIVGGESGANARPMHPDWARSLRDQCQAAGVAFFFKQWGEWLPRPLDDWKDEHQRYLGERAPDDHVHVYRHGALARKYDPIEMRKLDGRLWNDFPEAACPSASN